MLLGVINWNNTARHPRAREGPGDLKGPTVTQLPTTTMSRQLCFLVSVLLALLLGAMATPVEFAEELEEQIVSNFAEDGAFFGWMQKRVY